MPQDRFGQRANALWRNAVKPQAFELYKLIKEPVLVIAAVFVSTTAIAAPFYVPSGSMEPTLQIGDGLIATKYDYGYSRYSPPFAFGPSSETRLFQKMPKRGDIVIFRLPHNPAKTLIKRLVGLPGDKIQMREGRLWINGKQLPLKADGTGTEEWRNGEMITVARYVETFPNGVTHPIFKHAWDGPLDNTQMFVVPKNHFFMMGDNRDDSSDSRVPPNEDGVGYVPTENLVAHAEIVVGSYDFLGGQADKGWFGRVRTARFFTALN
jgi:signal peptidase I